MSIFAVIIFSVLAPLTQLHALIRCAAANRALAAPQLERYTSHYFLKLKIVNPIPPLHKLFENINDSLNTAELTPEVRRRFQQWLQSALARMDLVTREEFDAQAKVLQHTRERLEALERELAELASQVTDSPK